MSNVVQCSLDYQSMYFVIIIIIKIINQSLVSSLTFSIYVSPVNVVLVLNCFFVSNFGGVIVYHFVVVLWCGMLFCCCIVV